MMMRNSAVTLVRRWKDGKGAWTYIPGGPHTHTHTGKQQTGGPKMQF